MKTTRMLLTASLLAAVLFVGAAAAQDKVTIGIRIVNASKEGEKHVPPQLRDVARRLAGLPYKSYALVGTKKKKGISQGSGFRLKLNQVDTLVVQRGKNASGGKVRLTAALVRYDADEEKEATKVKLGKALPKGASLIITHNQVLVNGKPTLFVVTYLE